MDAITCIKHRRSIRSFQPKAVETEVITKIVEAAAYAPSWKNSQTSRYVVITDPALKSRIAAEATMGFAGNAKIIENAPALVVQCSVAKRAGYERDGSFSTSKEDRWESFDAGIACQTFVLAADEYGVGSVIMGIFDQDIIREIAQIPAEQNVASLIAIGYAAEEPSAPRRKTVDDLLKIL